MKRNPKIIVITLTAFVMLLAMPLPLAAAEEPAVTGSVSAESTDLASGVGSTEAEGITETETTDASVDSSTGTGSSTFTSYGEDSSLNIEVRGTYSNGLSQGDSDWYCLTYRRQLDADEDPETEDICHIYFNAAYGLRGYVEPGWYDLIGICYQGDNTQLEGLSVAAPSLLRPYSDTVAQVSVAIGAQAVQKLTGSLGEGNVYVEASSASSYTADSSRDLVEANDDNPESLFTDLSVFGDDTEAMQRYLDSLYEQGLVDENYQYTEKAREQMTQDQSAVGAELLDTDGNAILVTQEETTESETEPDTTVTTGVSSDNSGAAQKNNDTDSSVKEKRYDTTDGEENYPTEEAGSSHPAAVAVIRYMPLVILIICAVIYFFYKKNK